MIIQRNSKVPYRIPQKKNPILQKIILNNYVRIGPPYHMEEEIKKAFTLTNPEFSNLVKRRRLNKADWPECGFLQTKEKNKKGIWKTVKIYRWIHLWDYDGASRLIVPRGAFGLVQKIFERHGRPYEVENLRKPHSPINFPFLSELMKEKGQLPFLKYKAGNGCLQSGTGTGKTVMGLFQAKRFKQPTLIIVDTTELMEQWKARISEHMGIRTNKIGQIGSGIKDIKSITVALIQTLRKVPELVNHFGFVIVDEYHDAVIESFFTVLREYTGPYAMGLSATPRKGPKGKIMEFYLGPLSMKLRRENAEILPATGIFVNTQYISPIPFRYKYAQAKALMLADPDRNELILNTILKNINIFGIHLIISSSSKQLHTLYEMMPDHIKLISRIITGGVPKKERKQIVKEAMENKLKFLLGTDKILEKGFDEELLSVLHIVAPKGNPDKIQQGCGRVTRVPKKEHVDIREKKKQAWIFYYFDWRETTLRGSASSVAKVFTKLRISKKVIKDT